jgi:FKBP-type peptidyl-prolyl cis-trans isomerase (trigger factor)
MAIVTRENIGLLNDKLVVKVAKDDYLPSFEKAIKEYSKKANIPGFRKGMVPAGMVKKMYGSSVFTDEVIKSVEKGLSDYMMEEKLDIFAQPLPLSDSDASKLDMNNPDEYAFSFEVGLKPEFEVADLSKAKITRYKVTVDDKLIDEAIENIRGGNKQETAEGEEAAEPAPKAELNEDLFKQVFPTKEITTIEDFRAEVKTQIQAQWDSQAQNQLLDQIYHSLLDNTKIEFPADFLKRWMQKGGEEEKSAEEIEKEFPSFVNQLKWTLITDKLVKDNSIEVKPEEIRAFAVNQLFGYLGGMGSNQEDMMQQPWVTEYVDKMMKDRKFIEDSYHRIQTDKVFAFAEGQVKAKEKEISSDEFAKMQKEHHH